jgi:hypothetical protein
MADTLVERVTGTSSAADLPVEIHVVMTDESLFRGDDRPAEVSGLGPVPAGLVRGWVRDTEAALWLRRLYLSPVDGSLVAMDSRRREFRGLLRRFLVLRDGVCRTPWCGAPIRHVDHLRRAADGGPTSATNAQGLCQACNLAKEAVAWRVRADAGAAQTTTPTGHRYRSRCPSLVPSRPSPLEARFRDLVLGA